MTHLPSSTLCGLMITDPSPLGEKETSQIWSTPAMACSKLCSSWNENREVHTHAMQLFDAPRY